jgi:small conductance mechanosensitive channel
MKLVVGAAPPPSPGTVSTITDSLKKPVGVVETAADKAMDWFSVHGPSVIGALILLLAAWFLAGWLKRLVLRASQRARLDLTLSKFLGNLVRWGVIFFAIVMCLGTFGINTTSFAAVIGAAGLAVGLALQGNLGNLASGVLLLVFRPFKIGDSVIVAGQSGIVDGIDLFTTNLDTLDNRRIIVPNSAIFGGVIENQTRHPNRVVAVSIPVSPLASFDEIKSVLEGAIDRVLSTTPGALRDPAPSVVLAEIAPAVIWTVNIWVETARYGACRPAVLREVKSALDAAKLGPRPPVSDVHIRSMPS